MNGNIIILAAGQGTRMKSRLPKVLHQVAGKPMLEHVIQAARGLGDTRVVVVYGHGGEQVRSRFAEAGVLWAEQAQQLGTGHAVEQALPLLDEDQPTLVLYGDVPLIQTETLERMLKALDQAALVVLTAELDDPTGYGRIVREGGEVVRIVEHKDADAETLGIHEVNSGIMAFDTRALGEWVRRLENDNAQGEFYLTDCVALAREDGKRVAAVQVEDAMEIEGVNDRMQLAMVERAWQRRQARQLMKDGLTLRDPARFDLRGTLEFGMDCEIDPNCIVEGRVRLGDGVRIGANCVLRDCEIGDGVMIEPNSVLDGVVLERDCRIGPFARLRPGTRMGEGSKAGNFVEIKNSRIGAGSKINHLSYIGDTEMGDRVNIGAGTITCNYDGANKHRTRIGDEAFIGSSSQLVAPVEIGPGATIGAGSTVTRDAPAGKLTLSRAKQITIEGWKRPQKKGD